MVQLTTLPGGQGWDRTSYTRIFNPLLYRMSYLTVVTPDGLEPTLSWLKTKSPTQLDDEAKFGSGPRDSNPSVARVMSPACKPFHSPAAVLTRIELALTVVDNHPPSQRATAPC